MAATGGLERIRSTLLLGLALGLSTWALAGCGVTETRPTGPNGRLERTWLEHNVDLDGQRGMKVYATFEVDNCKGRPIELTAYFSQQAGEALADVDGQYKTEDGKVCHFARLTPKYEGSRWEAYWLFMPYDQLHVDEPGDHALKCRLYLWALPGVTGENQRLATGDPLLFKLTNPEGGKEPALGPRPPRGVPKAY